MKPIKIVADGCCILGELFLGWIPVRPKHGSASHRGKPWKLQSYMGSVRIQSIQVPQVAIYVIIQQFSSGVCLICALPCQPVRVCSPEIMLPGRSHVHVVGFNMHKYLETTKPRRPARCIIAKNIPAVRPAIRIHGRPASIPVLSSVSTSRR